MHESYSPFGNAFKGLMNLLVTLFVVACVGMLGTIAGIIFFVLWCLDRV